MLLTTLKAVRISKKLKLKEVAKKICVSEDTLRNYENFVTYPDVKTLKKLLILYDVDYDYIALTPEEVNKNVNGCLSSK